MADSENAFAECRTRTEVLGQLAGAASTCWSTLEGAGVFDSQQAYRFVTDAERRLEEIQEQESAERLAELAEFTKTQGRGGTGPHRLDSVWNFAEDVAVRTWSGGVQLTHRQSGRMAIEQRSGTHQEMFARAKERLAASLTYWTPEGNDE